MSFYDADELLPWWLLRQTDPASPDVLIGDAALVSSTNRSWTMLGTVGEADPAVIDPRGLLSVRPDSWSLDWWIGADDRWHLPSRAAGVRQRVIDGTPVVETTVRIPGGELTHRAWAVAAGDGVPVGGAIAVELHNASPVPVAIALAIRPFGPDGRTSVSHIEVAGLTARVDGHPALLLPKAPSRVAFGSATVGDAIAAVESGAASSTWPDEGVHCAEGRASAALLFPLPHTATLRVLVPLAPPHRGRRRHAPVAPEGTPVAAPDFERVVAGWQVQTRRSPRIELPENRVEEALATARRFALVHAAGDDAHSWSDGLLGAFDSCALISALDQHGLHAEAARLLMGLDDRIDINGRFEDEPHRLDSGAAWLCAVASHVALADDAVMARSLIGDIAKVAHRVHRDAGAHLAGRRTRSVVGPSWASTPDALVAHELIWAVGGLRAAVSLLRLADQPAAAEEVAAHLAELEPAVGTLLHGTISTSKLLAAVAALVESGAGDATLLDAHRDRIAELLQPAVWQDTTGFSPRLTASLAIALARVGDARCLDALRWFLEVGAPTWAWPEFVHPRTQRGSAGDGHAAVSTAAFLRLVRALVVDDSGDRLELLPIVAESWLGQGLEVHDLPTRAGRSSVAVRWHGARPALLWDVVTPVETVALASAPFGLGCPGLDPDWHREDRRGEGLLAAPEAGTVDGPGPAEGDSFA